MEYDSDRAGGFEPLRFVPKGKMVVLGLVTSKSGALEIRTSSSAASTRPRNSSTLDQLCLSPQCGFASTEEGNILTEDEQWAKLRGSWRSPKKCGDDLIVIRGVVRAKRAIQYARSKISGCWSIGCSLPRA